MRFSLFSALRFLGLFCIAIQIAEAGEKLDFKVVKDKTTETVTLWLQSEHARLSSSANSHTAVLFNAHTQVILLLDHHKKTVTTLDQATIKQFASVAKGVGELARSQGGVLGDLFKTFGLDNQIGNSPTITVENKGMIKLMGQPCLQQHVFKESKLTTRLCIADKLTLGKQEEETLHSLVAFARLLLQQGQIILEQFNLPIPVLPENLPVGVPIYIEDIPSNAQATMVGLKRLTVPLSHFSAPSGYSKKTIGL